MKYKWLNKENNNKLIIFFNGWGMDENAIKHLQAEEYDIVMLYDYNSLDTDLKFDKEYEQINLIAWSMGVMAASVCFKSADGSTDKNPFSVLYKTCKKFKSVAMNGTLKPIDFEYGIHPKIYDLTIQGFDEKGRDKFVSNMFDYSSGANVYKAGVREDSLENLRAELAALKNYKGNEYFSYDKVYISKNDKIIPTKHQVNYWGVEPNLEGGHYPFFNFAKWSEIL